MLKSMAFWSFLRCRCGQGVSQSDLKTDFNYDICEGPKPEQEATMAIRALVWNENEHEKRNALVKKLYPDGIHNAIAQAFAGDSEIEVSTATLDMPEHGL